jgi:hypothetical protein
MKVGMGSTTHCTHQDDRFDFVGRKIDSKRTEAKDRQLEALNSKRNAYDGNAQYNTRQKGLYGQDPSNSDCPYNVEQAVAAWSTVVCIDRCLAKGK